MVSGSGLHPGSRIPDSPQGPRRCTPLWRPLRRPCSDLAAWAEPLNINPPGVGGMGGAPKSGASFHDVCRVEPVPRTLQSRDLEPCWAPPGPPTRHTVACRSLPKTASETGDRPEALRIPNLTPSGRRGVPKVGPKVPKWLENDPKWS